MTFSIVAIAPNYWGSGKTMKEAIKECKAAGYCGKKKPRIYICDSGFDINPWDGAISVPKESVVGCEILDWGGYPSDGS